MLLLPTEALLVFELVSLTAVHKAAKLAGRRLGLGFSCFPSLAGTAKCCEPESSEQVSSEKDSVDS